MRNQAHHRCAWLAPASRLLLPAHLVSSEGGATPICHSESFRLVALFKPSAATQGKKKLVHFGDTLIVPLPNEFSVPLSRETCARSLVPNEKAVFAKPDF